MIAARLSQKQMDIVSPNSYAALETYNWVNRIAPTPGDPESVKQFLLFLKQQTINSLCATTLREQGRDKCEPSKCYWHGKFKWPKKKPQEGESQDIAPPELPNTGSKRQKRDPSSKSLDH